MLPARAFQTLVGPETEMRFPDEEFPSPSIHPRLAQVAPPETLTKLLAALAPTVSSPRKLVHVVPAPETFTIARAPFTCPRTIGSPELPDVSKFVPPRMFQITTPLETVPMAKSRAGSRTEPCEVVSVPAASTNCEFVRAGVLLVTKSWSAIALAVGLFST